MVFQCMVILFFLLIAYVHYIQGLFSAGLSAIYCVLAAVLAVGYHESVAGFFMKVPEEAASLSIIVVFALAYLIPKILSDKLISGNVRFPVGVDKAGAAIMGIIAGLVGTGVFAIAAQLLPFDGSFGMYSRLVTHDRPGIMVPGAMRNGSSADAINYDEVQGNGNLTDASQASGLWLGQDNMVLALANKMSGSTLSTGHPFASVHPDYMLEAFGQRLGVASGGKHLAISPGGANQIKFADVYQLPNDTKTMDGMDPAVRDGEHKIPEIDKTKILVVVRANIAASTINVNDTDGKLRLAVANVRLVVNNNAGDYQNVFAIGTCVNNHTILLSRSDDPLIADIKGTQTIDFVFQVDPAYLTITTDATKGKTAKFNDGSFIEMKRYATQDLSGTVIKTTVPDKPASNDTASAGGIWRQSSVLTKASAAG